MSMTHDAPERTAPAATTATTGRMIATAQCIVADLSIDGEVNVYIGVTNGRPSLHLSVRRDRVNADGREELAAQLADQIGGRLEILGYRDGMRIAVAHVHASDGSYMHVSARLDEGAAR